MARLRAAAVKRAQYQQRRVEGVRRGLRQVAIVLETRLIDQRSEYRGVGNLRRLVRRLCVIAARDEIKTADPGVLNVQVRELVSNRQRIVFAELIIHSGRQGNAELRRDA